MCKLRIREDCINSLCRILRNNVTVYVDPGNLHVHRLTIVIPVLGDPLQLDDTLLSVLENRPTDCEILVVHNEPYHDPYNLSDEVRFIEARRGAGLVECVHRGIAASQGSIIHVLTCGVQVCSGWTDAALSHFEDPKVAAVSALIFDRNAPEQVLSAGLGYRLEGAAWRLAGRNTASQIGTWQQELRGPDLLAGFYSKAAIQSVGGFAYFASSIAAGVDLALALEQIGFRCIFEPECTASMVAATGAESAFQRGRNDECLFWRWAANQGLLTSIIGHIAMLAGQAVIGLFRPSTLVQLVGRSCGMLQAVFIGRRTKPAAVETAEKPTVATSPHFAVAHSQEEEQRSFRVA